MSASREKQKRQAHSASGEISPKTAREAQRMKEERRSAVLYSAVGVVLVLVVAASVLWNSGIISRSAAAVTVDGQKYSAAQTSFYYRNIYSNFANGSWRYFVNLDTSQSLDSQTLDESAASMLDAEEGITWRDYFLNRAFEQMASIQNGLRQAEEEGFVFPEDVQSDYESNLETLSENARLNGVSTGRYLKNLYGSQMTERVYRAELMRSLQYQSFAEAYEDRLTYTDEEIETAYQESADDYDLVSYESLSFDGSVPETEAEPETAAPAEPEAAEEPAEDAVLPDSGGTSDGTASDGAASDGTASDGAASDGGASDGTASDGTVSDGAANVPESAGDAAVNEDAEAETEEAAEAVEETEEEAEEDAGPTEEEIEAAHAAARALAEAALSRYTAGSLSAAAPDAPYTADDGISFTDASAVGTELADWLFDSARKTGDTGVVQSGDTFYTVLFRDRFRDEGKSTVNVRHILIQPEEGTLEEDADGYAEEQARLNTEAQEKAESVYEEWKNGDATEDSFADLAAEYSGDGNAADGGLYEDVREGQMVPAFNDWCFDESRKPGDTGIVETDYGFHVMYYVGDNAPRWKNEAEDGLRTDDFAEWQDSLTENADIVRSDFGLRFVN